MWFLPPRPSSTGSMAASPAPDGGGVGLFRGYSTQRHCLLLRWASTRVPNKRKCSKEVSCQSTTKGGLLGLRPSSSFSPPGLGDLSVSTEIRWAWFYHLQASWAGLPAGAVALRKDNRSSTLLPDSFPKAQLPTYLSAVRHWQWLPTA